MTPNELDVIQEKIGYEFNEHYLLTQAFTRRSFASENQNYEDNEKLEFVGDKVLDFIVVKKLAKEYSFVGRSLVQSMASIEMGEKPSRENLEEKSNFEFAYTENEMTEIKKQIVQTDFLSNAIEALGIEKYLIMGRGDVKMGVQNEPHVKEDLFEAIIGAVAIDCGWNMEILERVVEKMLNLSYYIKNGVDGGIDYVSYLREWHMKEYGREPEYKYISFGGDNGFQCNLTLSGYVGGDFDGIARSKKAATRIVAMRAYEYLKEKAIFVRVVMCFLYSIKIIYSSVAYRAKVTVKNEFLFHNTQEKLSRLRSYNSCLIIIVSYARQFLYPTLYTNFTVAFCAY